MQSGVLAQVVTPRELASHGERPDLVHTTFLFDAESLGYVLEFVKSSRVPSVVTPLFEEMLPQWFDAAVGRRGKWQSAALVFGRKRMRWLFTRWHTARRRRDQNWHVQRTFLTYSHVLPDSQHAWQHLVKWFDLPDSVQHTTTPLGVDPEHFRPPEVPERLPELPIQDGFVLQVGRIEPRKNQVGLLQALQTVGLDIVLVGQTPRGGAAYRCQCEALARLRGRVHFIESVSYDHLPNLYARAGVHTLPSWSERPGLVTLEAAACGCRVVATRPGPITEYLGSAAEYCQPDDQASIRRAILDSLSRPNPDGLADKVRRQFTWQRTADITRSAYEQVLEHA